MRKDGAEAAEQRPEGLTTAGVPGHSWASPNRAKLVGESDYWR